jgi:hypothetical protein
VTDPGIVHMWQGSNEMGISTFRSPLSIQQAVRFITAGGRGVKKQIQRQRPTSIRLAGKPKTTFLWYLLNSWYAFRLCRD